MNFFIIFGLLVSLNIFAEDQLETIEVVDHSKESSLEHYGHSSKKLHTRELKKRREISLGDTLKSEAGVTSNSFGPNASRPVIRGLDGDRIKILQNGLGVLDASAQSADHAVPVDTLIIDSVEVVRGPLALLYGSSAVGGVVNVTTNRIHSHYEKGMVKEIQIQGDSSNNGVSSGAKVDYGVSDWMLHLDAGYRNLNDTFIPGYQRSAKKRDMDPQTGESKNNLKNSMSVQKSIGAGASKVFNKGYAGLSYYHLDNYYGTVAEETVKINMSQDRLEFHGEYRPGGVIKNIRFKTAQSDYGHKEMEGSEVGTTFLNEGNETRLEFLTKTGDVHGVSGAQTQMFNFSAVGDEAFLPTTKNTILSLFTLQELSQGAHTYSLGGRWDNTNIENTESSQMRNFNGASTSAGYLYHWNPDWASSLNLSYTERAPSFQELFAGGPHLATSIYELGDDELNKEKAYAADLGLKFDQGRNLLTLNFYTQQFKDYVALSPTGTKEDGLDKSLFNQVDAIFYGVDFEAKKEIPNTLFLLVTRGDLVRAKNKDDGKNLPRISPPRLSLGIERQADRWSWDVEAQYNFEQTKTSPDELRTDSFILLNAGVNYDLPWDGKNFSSFLRFKNILNQEARVHASTLKDIAPMPGRSAVAGVQYLF